MEPIRVRNHFLINGRRVIAGILLILTALPATAFEQLSAAQSLIYDTGHLNNTREGDIIRYHYTATGGTGIDVSDAATLIIARSLPEGRRDVELDFLSDSRHLALPPFSGYRGNPVIIAMLEHIAQTMASSTGGSTLYFRNRIRDALATEGIPVQTGNAQYAQRKVSTSSISFAPFTNDGYLDKSSVFRNALFTVQFSDAVPAGIVEIAVTAQTDEQKFSRILSLE